jgi:hypothetical protein
MTPRTIEVLDQRGIADRFLDAGTIGQNGHYAGLFFDVSGLPTLPELTQREAERSAK